MTQLLRNILVRSGFFLVVLVFQLCLAHANPLTFDHSHSKWDRLLKQHTHWHITNSTVNYSALHSKPHQLDEYLQELEGLDYFQYREFTQNQKLAFLINAYNALVLKLILSHYPILSIKDVEGIFSSPWKKEVFRLFGKTYSLQSLFDQLIRKTSDDPRIHFALTNAAMSSPALRGIAFVPDHLDAQLDKSTKAFL